MVKKKSIATSLITAFVLVCAIFVFTQNADAVTETKRTNYTLMKGVTESMIYATESHGNNVSIHLVRINDGANVSLKTSNANYYSKNSTAASRKKYAKNWTYKKWGYRTVADQAKRYESSKDAAGKVIAATNGDFYLKGKYNGMTLGTMILEGNAIRKTSSVPFFATLKDGSHVIRDGKESKTDVKEALSGRWLVRDGQIANWDNSFLYPTMAIGITEDKTVVIANVDGRDIASLGATPYDTAEIMRAQGCVDVIQLDGGGSASFLTKRSGNKSLVVRNKCLDGFPRNVSSGLLVVKNKKSSTKAVTGETQVSMKDGVVKLTKDASGVYHYIMNGKGIDSFRLVNGVQYLFNQDGKGLTKTVKVAGCTYKFTKGRLTSSPKGAGKVVFGYCGANNGGKNLIYVYQYGNKRLNIGLNPLVKKNNGKMKNWTNIVDVPWQIEKHRIKSVYIGAGVKNVGSTFMRITLSPFNDTIKKKKPALKTVSLPVSLQTIGKDAFYNHYNLKKVVIPKNVKSIGAYAFYYSNGTQFTFKRTVPPSIGKKAFTKNATTKKKVKFVVPNKTKWKKYMKNKKKMKTIGFSGTVKYKK